METYKAGYKGSDAMREKAEKMFKQNAGFTPGKLAKEKSK